MHFDACRVASDFQSFKTWESGNKIGGEGGGACYHRNRGNRKIAGNLEIEEPHGSLFRSKVAIGHSPRTMQQWSSDSRTDAPQPTGWCG